MELGLNIFVVDYILSWPCGQNHYCYYYNLYANLTFLQPAKRPAAVAASCQSRPVKEARPAVRTEARPQAKPVSFLIFLQ